MPSHPQPPKNPPGTGTSTLPMTRILMVCMGNICRSPIAEAVLHHQAQAAGVLAQLHIDSAGTHGHYHAGEAPDPRAMAAAAQRSYTQIFGQRARPVKPDDFEQFDLIVAMDRDNLANLTRMCPAEQQAKLRLLLAYASELGVQEVPDPYYGNLGGFERVLDLCEAGVRGLLRHRLQTR